VVSGHEKLAKHFFDQFQASLATSDLDLTLYREKSPSLPTCVGVAREHHIPYVSIGKIAVEFTP